MWDLVWVYFEDGTKTLIAVHEDDSIQDALVQLCEDNGWDTSEVRDFAIEDTVTTAHKNLLKRGHNPQDTYLKHQIRNLPLIEGT
jgi:hypothetical protein